MMVAVEFYSGCLRQLLKDVISFAEALNVFLIITG
jgi:hypothetical protein